MIAFFYRYRVEFLTVLLSITLVASVAAAQQVNIAAKKGTAADFILMFPWLVVGMVTLLFAVLAWFIKRYDEDREEKINKLVNEIANTNAALAQATQKLDATINTLFERDHDIERTISDQGAAIAGIRATCEARGRMCRLLDGDKIVCLDRRDGIDRRDDE